MRSRVTWRKSMSCTHSGWIADGTGCSKSSVYGLGWGDATELGFTQQVIRSIAAAKAFHPLVGQNPVCSGTTVNCRPPTSLATTGVPLAIASIATRPRFVVTGNYADISCCVVNRWYIVTKTPWEARKITHSQFSPQLNSITLYAVTLARTTATANNQLHIGITTLR